MPIYAHYGVAYAWLVDAKRRTLEVFALSHGRWDTVAKVEGEQVVTLPPFEAMQLELCSLWS